MSARAGTRWRSAAGPIVLLALVLLELTGCSHKPAHPDQTVQRWLHAGTAYIAHRGGDADWPEGTAYAYAQAAAWSPDLALEVPVRPTSDGVWVVSEDASTGRVFNHDYTISDTSWSTLSTLRTRTGNHPMARLVDDVLNTYGHDRVLFIDDKAAVALDSFFAALQPFHGQQRFVIKSYWQSAAVPKAARDHGYQTWGYYYAKDMGEFAATESRYDLLGLDYTAPATDFATMRATGKPIIAHVIPTAAAAKTALGDGANGLMVSGVEQVVPRT